MLSEALSGRNAGCRDRESMGLDNGAVSKVLRGGGRQEVGLIVGKVGLYG